MPISHNHAGKWLHLPVEWFAREFPSKLLVAIFGACRGYTVTIGDQKLYRRNMHRIPKGLYFRKSFKPNQYDEIKFLIDNGFTVIGGDEEFFVLYGEKGVILTSVRVNRKTMESMDGIFAWGQQLKNVLAENYPGLDEKIHVTGTPRLDLYRPEFRHLYAREADTYKERFGPFILFNSNFAIATAPSSETAVRLDHQEHQRLAALNGRSQAELSEADIYMDRYVQYTKRGLDDFLEAIPRVNEAFPDHTLVIRPHPADQIEFWQRYAEDKSGITVVRENHVGPWLLACEAMFHHGCSTAIEGWILGTPVVAYHPNHDKEFTEIGGLVGNNATNADELVLQLHRVIGKRDIQREDHDWMHEHFAGISGSTAAERTINALEHFEIERVESHYNEISPWANLSGFKKLERQWRYFRDRHLKFPPRTVQHGSSWRTQPKWPNAISVADIQDMVRGYSVNFPEFESVKVGQIDDALFVLET